MSTDTVPAAVMIPPEPRLGGEGDMIREDRWQEIHQLFEVEHVSIAEIARRLDLDRKTVRRALQQPTWQPYQRPPREDTLLAGHASFLRERSAHVQYSARILDQELRLQRGFRGSYDTVKRVVQPLRAAQVLAERATVRFETPPGRLGTGLVYAFPTYTTWIGPWIYDTFFDTDPFASIGYRPIRMRFRPDPRLPDRQGALAACP